MSFSVNEMIMVTDLAVVICFTKKKHDAHFVLVFWAIYYYYLFYHYFGGSRHKSNVCLSLKKYIYFGMLKKRNIISIYFFYDAGCVVMR